MQGSTVADLLWWLALKSMYTLQIQNHHCQQPRKLRKAFALQMAWKGQRKRKKQEFG